MVAALFLSRLLGMVRDTVMTARFGINLHTDAYRVAVTIPDTVFMLIAGGGLQNAFMPIFADLWHKDRKEQAWRTFSTVTTFAFLGSSVLVAVAALFNRPLIDFFADKKAALVGEEAARISLVMLPMQVAFLTGSVLIATLYVRRRYAAPALAPNLYNLGLIFGAALLPPLLGMGVESMAWGALVGAVIGNLVIPALLMAREGSSFRPSLDWRDEGVRRFFKLLLPVVLGFSLPSVVNTITTKFASQYPGEGTNTVMFVSANLMQAPLGIFGAALALAAFPVLAEFVATNRMDRYRDQISRTLSTCAFLGLASTAIFLALAPNIAHLLYGFGKAARSPEDVDLIASVLRWYAPGVAFWCLQPVLMRGFFSLQKTLEPIALGTIMTVVFIGLCLLTRGLAPGWLPGLAVASDLAGLGLALILFVGLERNVGRLDRARVFGTLGKGAVVAGAAVLVGWPLGALATRSNRLVEFIATAVVAVLMAWIMQFGGKLLKLPETEYLDRAFAKLGRRR